jgi:hypothetical protein
MQPAADFHALAAVQHDGRGVAGNMCRNGFSPRATIWRDTADSSIWP